MKIVVEMTLYGVDVSCLTADEIMECFVIPLNPVPQDLFKRARRRQRKWASDPSSPRFWIGVQQAKRMLDEKNQEKTRRRLLELINIVQLTEIVVLK